MEYHSHIFEDFSVMVFKNNKLEALFPANRVENILYSHQGLTFGGLLLPVKNSISNLSLLLNDICKYYKDHRIKEINIKLIPEIYFKFPSFELSYLLVQKKATIYQRNMVLAINYFNPLNIHKTKIKHYKKGKLLGLEINEEEDFTLFWNKVLVPRLKEKHNVNPVHTLEEITMLHNRYPKNIKQFNVYLNNKILAGITVFENENIVKSQYGAITKIGEQTRALDFLFLSLIYKYKNENKHFFSMGTVTENNELGYNEGLLKQKKELGCSIYLQDYFNLQLL